MKSLDAMVTVYTVERWRFVKTLIILPEAAVRDGEMSSALISFLLKDCK